MRKRKMLGFDVFVPLVMPSGSKIPKKKLETLKSFLLAQFGGVTYFSQNNEGLWKMGAYTFRDRIVIFRMISEQNKETQRFFVKLKRQIEKDWQQKEVLILSRAIKLV